MTSDQQHAEHAAVLRALQEAANEAADDAETGLVHAITEGHPWARAADEAAYLRAVARWWDEVEAALNPGQPPAHALHAARECAHRYALRPTAEDADPAALVMSLAFAAVRHDAARDFYLATSTATFGHIIGPPTTP